MKNENIKIGENYAKFYSDRKAVKVYPTEFVVRIFLAQYPDLVYKRPQRGDSVIDVGFGDGRNTAFLCDLGLNVSGIEIAHEIVDLTKERLQGMGHAPDLRVGRNSQIPYEDNSFDYILACHSCYYCDNNETILDNMREYARVLRSGGWLIASIVDVSSFIFNGALKLPDGTYEVRNDPYQNRVGYRLHAFQDTNSIKKYLSPFFTTFSFAHSNNDYFGINERVFWVVCENTKR